MGHITVIRMWENWAWAFSCVCLSHLHNTAEDSPFRFVHRRLLSVQVGVGWGGGSRQRQDVMN